MKMLIQILLLALLVGCASAYHPVYVNNEGDYYIEERVASEPYYGSGSMVFTDIGLYPWRIMWCPPPFFTYYSPYFYPHYFSVWYPPGYHPYYTRYRDYYSYRYPSYRHYRQHGHRSDRGRVVGPVSTYPAGVYSRPATQPHTTLPYVSVPQMRTARSANFSRPSTNPRSASRGLKASSPSPALNKQ